MYSLLLLVPVVALLAGTGWLRQRRRRPASDDRGSVLVEAAIITPVFIALIMGMIEFGMAYKDELSVTTAVRAGTRMGSAEPRMASFAQDTANQVARAAAAIDLTNVQALWVYKANSGGYPGSGTDFSSCTANCISFTWNGTTFSATGGSGWAYTAQDACQGEQDSIGVYLQYKHLAVTSLFFTAITETSHSVMVLEPIPALSAGGCK